LTLAKDEINPSKRRSTTRQPQPGRGRAFVHALLLLVAVVIVADTVVGDRGLLAMKRAQKEYEELATTIARTKAENARLREEARRLREDPKAIEEIARRELGLIKPGEKLFILRDVPPPASTPTGSRY
jgi:cell division protein FtsB